MTDAAITAEIARLNSLLKKREDKSGYQKNVAAIKVKLAELTTAQESKNV